MQRRHRVVVVGAGFGGLQVAKGLADVPVDVVVVDANNFHTFQPLLYQVATAGLDADDIAAPVRGIVSRLGNVDVRLGRVVGLDLRERVLRLEDGPDLGFDTLVLAAGAVTNTFGIPGVAEHATGLKSLTDAVRLRHCVLAAFERAAVDPAVVDDGALTVVVAGGGPTGVELAGGLVELFDKVLARDFPTLDVRRARVVLVEPTDRLLGGFHPRLSERARRTLAARGVEVVLGRGVASAGATSVELDDGTRIPAHTLVWTAGVTASPLGRLLADELRDGTGDARGDAPGGGALVRGGRVKVDEHLRVPGHPEVFVIGDLAATPGPDGAPLPQVAPVAVQGGEHVARVIAAALDGTEVPAFRYRDRGSMATIGRHDAVAQLPGGVRLAGPVGWLAWLALHLVMLIGFRNRANVLVNWAWNYLTWDRGARLMVGSEDPPGT
ncbi:MAG: NAD(P)/FAD-dependent oxidoreductase [Microthrixaceae bacterium]